MKVTHPMAEPVFSPEAQMVLWAIEALIDAKIKRAINEVDHSSLAEKKGYERGYVDGRSGRSSK